MNTTTPTKSENKLRPSQILGGPMGWLDETSFETEAALNTVTRGVGGILTDVVSLFTEDVAGVEPQNEQTEHKQISSTGSIEFSKAQAKQAEDIKQKEEAASKRIFYQALKEEVSRVENARDRMIYEEEIADIGAHMSDEKKNDLLHYQKSYKDRSIYQMAELRKKIIEQRKKSEKEEKEANIAQTQNKGKTAIQGIFEGASGTQGGGMANLSSTGGGAG